MYKISMIATGYCLAVHAAVRGQERIEPAREHATTHVNYIDSEIQTWRPYSK